MQIVPDGNSYHDDTNKNGSEDISKQSELAEEETEGLLFGDFTSKDYDAFFACNNLRNLSVQFLCDTHNDTKSWVEEGHKHLLDYEPIDDVPINYDNHTDEPSDVESADIKLNVSFEEAGVNVVSEADNTANELSEQVSHLHLNENSYEKSTPDVVYPEVSVEQDENDATENEELHHNENGHATESLKSDAEHVPKTLDDKPNPDQSQKKSWASLFKTPGTTNGVALNGTKNISAVKVEIAKTNNEIVEKSSQSHQNQPCVSMISMEQDERASKLAEFISHWYPDYSRSHVQLHGLVNRANWCYINATLQALLAIPAIYHFYKNLKEFLNDGCVQSTSTPLTDSMITFFNRFQPIEVHSSGKKESEDLHYGSAFEPKCVYDVLSVMKSSLSEKGRQEDAEEFLSFLLNGIHDELVALGKLVQAKVPKPPTQPEIMQNGETEMQSEFNDSEDEVWEEVGPKNKVRTIRKAVIEESLMKHVFGGVICSSVLQTGVKESTTFQPFFTLQLDIQSDNIQTLNNAIEFYFMKEKLSGFTCAKTQVEVEASRRISLEELPLMFIFHLKYFVFDRKGGSQKLHKEIDIPVDLEIPRDILSNGKMASANTLRRYKLHAVVYHHGKHNAGGHYTASVHHGNPIGWVHFDDNHIKSVSMNETVKHQQGSVPYLLFYERIQHR